jgi:predicted amidohydrolase
MDQLILPNSTNPNVIAVLNANLRFYENALEFAHSLANYMTASLDKGAGIIVFPEYFGNLLMGMAGEPLDLESPNTLELLQMISPILQTTYLDIFQQISSKTDATIMGGTLAFYDNDKLVNRAFVFRRGRVILTQDKAHLMPIEEKWRMTRGSRLGLVEAGHQKVGILVCMDATYYEQARILENMGARLLLVPSANPAPFYLGEQIRGAWARAQSSQLFTAQSFLVGKLGSYVFEGKAGIYAPANYTDDKSGFLALAHKYDQEELVTAPIDYSKLEQVRQPVSFRYQSELSKFYQSKLPLDRF